MQCFISVYGIGGRALAAYLRLSKAIFQPFMALGSTSSFSSCQPLSFSSRLGRIAAADLVNAIGIIFFRCTVLPRTTHGNELPRHDQAWLFCNDPENMHMRSGSIYDVFNVVNGC